MLLVKEFMGLSIGRRRMNLEENNVAALSGEIYKPFLSLLATAIERKDFVECRIHVPDIDARNEQSNETDQVRARIYYCSG